MKSRKRGRRKSDAARTRSSRSEVQVIGIGASAGGLDAFRRFFESMPERSGLAFVLIQHFDPDHESHMAQLLSKYTSMKVREAANLTRIEPDSVYVIPPNRSMSISGGLLHLSVPVQRRGLRTPIDQFFTSLAEDRGEKAVCIIMSSTGSDGVLGLRAVKAAGGMAMVQDPGTAQYGDMPRTAIATGLVDYVLPVEQMPRALLGYLSHAYISGPAAVKAGANDTEEKLVEIQKLLRVRTTHDFRYYKRGTLIRRIERRMGLNQVVKLSDYLNLLRRKPDEAIQLSKDLMIGVTSFFRDPEAYEELKTRVIHGMVRTREPDLPIRIWVPGCATGEEAYSITMLVLEELAAAGRSNKVQVFATDIDEDALQFARYSHYPESIAESIPADRLKRFFTPKQHGYFVNKVLRECVVFAIQNLITAPPFSKIDLISCRNLAIYLEPELQKKLIELFHFALNPGGCLFLGSSEGIGNRDDLFRPVSKKWRIYRRLGGCRRELGAVPILPAERPMQQPLENAARPSHAPNLAEINQKLMLEHYSLAGVLVDRVGKILHLMGPTSKYLELAAGEPTLDLHAVVREGLRARLRTAVQTAARDDRTVVLERESVKRDQTYHPVRVKISPVKSHPAAEGLVHVVFEDLPEAVPAEPSRKTEAAAAGEEKEGLLSQLESELKSTRDDLQNTIEELETSNEELKVANEEVLSSNEELQSTNEELETSKEELQSLNEELSTLNNQLQEKVQELTETSNDLANLLSSTEIATVFLDTRLRIKRFTTPVAKLLNLIPTDVGRPVRHLVQNLVGVNILNDVKAVLRKLVPIQRQVKSKMGDWYVMRVLPYRTTENVIEGVVITFTDVSELAAREEILRDKEKRQRIVVDLGRKALARMPLDRLMALAARRIEEVLGADAADVLLLEENGSRLAFKAGAGWTRARPGAAPIPTRGPTAPSQALRTRSTVFMESDPSKAPASLTPAQKAERVVASLYSVLVNSGGPLGVIGAHSRRKRAFTLDDAQFLEDLGPVLANAISRDRVEAELRSLSRRLEQVIRERTSWLAAMHEVARAANKAETTSEVLKKALMALCSGTGWRFGHVFLASQDPTKRPVFHGSCYPKGTEPFRPFEIATRKSTFRSSSSLPTQVLRSGRAVWVSPAAGQGNGAARGVKRSGYYKLRRLAAPRGVLARRLGLVSAAAVPVKVGSETVGVVEVFSDQALPPDPSMLVKLEQMGTEIGRSVERIQSQERFAAALWREQRAIAQELHDSVGQELTGLAAVTESLMGNLRKTGRVDARRLKRLSSGLRGTMEKLRHVTAGLFPQDVEDDGLNRALEGLVKRTQARFNIQVRILGNPRVTFANGEIATHLYRIAQEAVTNAVRHAKARRIDITLRRTPRDFSLSVRDDGKGLPPGRRASDGVGMRIMHHRAKAIGAHLVIRGGARGGTTVTCVLPKYGSSSPA